MSRPPDTPMYEYIQNTIIPVVANCAAISYQADGSLPDAFAVHYLVAGSPQAFFSGRPGRENERYSVAYYDRNKRNIEPKAAEIKAAMLAAGFLYIGKSADTYHDDSEHWARTLDFRYYEESEEE
jgi:hypothetical protein